MSAGDSPHPMNVNENGVLLDGYDVVAYFTASKAVPGSPEHVADYGGAKLFFSSRGNLEAFRAAPEKYMPKYGGYCAFAMANGKGLVKPNPKRFKLYRGQLLLFFDDLYEGQRFDTSIAWNADEPALYARAEENWSSMTR